MAHPKPRRAGAHLEEPVKDLLFVKDFVRALSPRHRLLQRAARAILHDDVEDIAYHKGAEVLGDVDVPEGSEQIGFVLGLVLLLRCEMLERDFFRHEALSS